MTNQNLDSQFLYISYNSWERVSICDSHNLLVINEFCYKGEKEMRI